MIKILHAADLHLDSAFSALSPEQAAMRRKEQRDLLFALAELSNAEACDLMLLAGDLFDSDNTYPDTLEALIEAFSKCRAQILIAPGNHDYAAAGSVYRTAKWPENVHIFTERKVTSVDFPALGCRVYGAGFTSAYEDDLLAGARAEYDGINLMVLHGDALQKTSPYNAVSREQIAASGMDYLALGHIHQRSEVLKEGDTYYAWPGCTMGRGFDETGEKGVYLGTIGKGECRLEFVPIKTRRYEDLQILAGDDARAAIEAALAADTADDIYRIRLVGEAEKINTRELYAEFSPRFWTLILENHTLPKREIWAGAQDDTLRGLFLCELKAQYDKADTEEMRRQIALAARLGLDAMEGREVQAF